MSSGELSCLATGLVPLHVSCNTTCMYFNGVKQCHSLSFQGLEIVNPQAAEKRVAEANAKYFSSTASFVKVEKELWHK